MDAETFTARDQGRECNRGFAFREVKRGKAQSGGGAGRLFVGEKESEPFEPPSAVALPDGDIDLVEFNPRGDQGPKWAETGRGAGAAASALALGGFTGDREFEFQDEAAQAHPFEPVKGSCSGEEPAGAVVEFQFPDLHSLQERAFAFEGEVVDRKALPERAAHAQTAAELLGAGELGRERAQGPRESRAAREEEHGQEKEECPSGARKHETQNTPTFPPSRKGAGVRVRSGRWLRQGSFWAVGWHRV